MSGTDYDSYWKGRDVERTRARSRRRAGLAAELLGDLRGTLLEVGSGPGWALEVFCELGFRARGVELSRVAVDLARARGLEVDLLNVESGELPGGFDVVVALEVLEHVADSLALLRRLESATRPGGKLVVSLPNEFTLPRRLAILAGRPGFGGHADPHVRHYDPASSRALFAAAGLEVLGRREDGLTPPRWKLAKALTEPLAGLAPGLFSLSSVFLLEPGAHAQRACAETLEPAKSGESEESGEETS